MQRKINHEQYVQSVREQIVKTAQAMLDGQMSYLLGARWLDSLRHDAFIKEDDADFLIFVAIASDSDDYPLGAVREHWDKQSLDKLRPEIDAAEAWAKSHAELTCANLISRFGYQPGVDADYGIPE